MAPLNTQAASNNNNKQQQASNKKQQQQEARSNKQQQQQAATSSSNKQEATTTTTTTTSNKQQQQEATSNSSKQQAATTSSSKQQATRSNNKHHLKEKLWKSSTSMEEIVARYKLNRVSERYNPVTDGSHRQLGVTLEGMYYFLEEIGFIEWRLPELWPSEVAARTGTPQREGLALTEVDQEYRCNICHDLIAVGEVAYVDQTRYPIWKEGNHVACLASVVAARTETPQREGLALTEVDQEYRCSICHGLIAVGEMAYVDKTHDHIWEKANHVACLTTESNSANRCEYGASLGWRYVTSYTRGDRLKWLKSPYPEIDTCSYMETSPGLRHMTGYDLVAFVQDWLEREELNHLSIAEIILTEDRFVHLREHVGIASIFWSHVDSEPVIDHVKGTLVRIREVREKYKDQLPARNEQYWWVDYFSLRQGISGDFDIDSMVRLIKSFKHVVCSIKVDGSLRRYLSRSFCLLELFSACQNNRDTPGAEIDISDGVNLICYGSNIHRGVLEAQLAPACPKPWQGWWPEKCWVGPVNTANGETSCESDKQTINAYIKNKFGFEAFDAIITKAILRSAACGEHRKFLCTECPLTFSSEPCHQHKTGYCEECWTNNFNFIGTNAIECKEHKRCYCSECYVIVTD